MAQGSKDLKDFVDKHAQTSHLRVESDLGAGFFRLRASEAQRRQAQQDIRSVEDAVIELLRNSRDAGARNIFLATNSEDSFRNLLVIDDGSGVPKGHHKVIFEPYVTSKLDTMSIDSWGVHGRGMALYSISVNSENAEVVKSDTDLGCAIAVKCNTKNLSEKRDQSTFPDFYVNDDKELVVRGPKNILRTACEFAVESRKTCNVFIGSPVEIAATLYAVSRSETSVASVFNEPDEDTKIVDLLGYSSDVHDFKKYAAEVGISLSKRTARRIMDGDIKPQASLLERIAKIGVSGSNASEFNISDVTKVHHAKPKVSTVKFDDSDKESLVNAIKQEFPNVAEKYYLKSDIDPKVTIKKNKISISFEVEEDQD